MCGFCFLLFSWLESTHITIPRMYSFNNWLIIREKMENFIQEFPAGDICSSHLMRSSNQPSVSCFYWFNILEIEYPFFFFLLIDNLPDTSIDSYTCFYALGPISPKGFVHPNPGDPFLNGAAWLKPVGTS